MSSENDDSDIYSINYWKKSNMLPPTITLQGFIKENKDIAKNHISIKLAFTMDPFFDFEEVLSKILEALVADIPDEQKRSNLHITIYDPLDMAESIWKEHASTVIDYYRFLDEYQLFLVGRVNPDYEMHGFYKYLLVHELHMMNKHKIPKDPNQSFQSMDISIVKCHQNCTFATKLSDLFGYKLYHLTGTFKSRCLNFLEGTKSKDETSYNLEQLLAGITPPINSSVLDFGNTTPRIIRARLVIDLFSDENDDEQTSSSLKSIEKAANESLPKPATLISRAINTPLPDV